MKSKFFRIILLLVAVMFTCHIYCKNQLKSNKNSEKNENSSKEKIKETNIKKENEFVFI
jgi:hypothetical protein